jgi:hypothetical protein
MRNLIGKLQSYWLGDASFMTLLVMLVAAVFVLPVIMEVSDHGVLLFNVLLLCVFFSWWPRSFPPWACFSRPS